jgi:membrane protein implicated in regulation of membrane protease activity
MAEWWSALSGGEQVFFIIAIASTFILLLQLILSLVGLAGHDVDTGGAEGVDVPHDVPADVSHDMPADVSHDGSVEHTGAETHSTGLSVISIRTVVAFFVGFGWAGVAAGGGRLSVLASLLIAIIVGIIFVLVVFYLMKGIYSLSEAGNIDLRNAVGQSGTVYLPIPARGHGTGQIQVVVQGRLRELPAVTDEDQPLPSGTHVRVVNIMGESTMLVRKVEVI